MKIYPYIVINKSDMTKLFHCHEPYQVVDKIMNFKTGFNKDNWIVIKNEKIVMDFSQVICGDMISIYRWLEKYLDKQ